MKALRKVFVEKSVRELVQEIHLLHQQGTGKTEEFNAGAVAALRWVLLGDARPSTITVNSEVTV